MANHSCPAPYRSAFIGEPSQVVLPPGERLFKMVTLPLDHQRMGSVRQAALASPWWIRERDFDELRSRAKRLRRPLAEFIRARVAIATDWNPRMDRLWIVHLAASVDAWEGRASGQPLRLADRDVLLIGGGPQVCVPGLTWRHVGVDHAATVSD